MNRENLGTTRLPGRWPSFAIACMSCTWLSRRCLPGDDAAWLEAQQEARAHECDPSNLQRPFLATDPDAQEVPR